MLFHLLYVYGAAVGWGFVVLYATRPFYRSAAGWNLMVFTASVALAFTLLLAGVGGAAVWLFLVLVLCLLLTHRLALLIHDIRSE